MKRSDIAIFEDQLNLLEKEVKILEESYNQKDKERFEKSKANMIRAQRRISGVVR